jgi:hypothetical protein
MENDSLYEIEKVNEQLYVVFNNTSRGLDTLLSIVTKRLEKSNFHGKIIFDLLLSNSVGSSRYIETDFNGKDIILSSLTKVKILNSEISNRSKRYFRKHPDLLSKSVLTKSQVEKLKQEIWDLE